MLSQVVGVTGTLNYGVLWLHKIINFFKKKTTNEKLNVLVTQIILAGPGHFEFSRFICILLNSFIRLTLLSVPHWYILPFGISMLTSHWMLLFFKPPTRKGGGRFALVCPSGYLFVCSPQFVSHLTPKI